MVDAPALLVELERLRAENAKLAADLDHEIRAAGLKLAARPTREQALRAMADWALNVYDATKLPCSREDCLDAVLAAGHGETGREDSHPFEVQP